MIGWEKRYERGDVSNENSLFAGCNSFAGAELDRKNPEVCGF